MAGMDVVCVEPDNGLVAPCALGRQKENKYVLASDLAGYYAQDSTVVYYQRKSSRKDDHYKTQSFLG